MSELSLEKEPFLARPRALLRVAFRTRLERRHAAWALAFLTLSLCFLWIERRPLFEWDEARHAVNAWEMAASGDWFNYTYGGAPDRWNAKPQLLVWLIALGYEIFGARELAVRWPSAVASCVTAVVMFRWLRLWFGREASLFGALVVLTMRGVVGYHVGRTGDMDALFLAFVVVSLFFLQKARGFSERQVRPWREEHALCAASGLALGFAFLSKGFAVGLVAPGFACLLLSRSCEHRGLEGAKSLAHPPRWRGVGTFLLAAALCPSLWIAAQVTQGMVHEGTAFGARSQLGTMVIYDVWQRVRGGVDGVPGRFDAGYLFRQLDVLASPWGYLFLLGLCASVVSRRFRVRVRARLTPGQPLHTAACVLLPSAILLMLMRHKLPWYMAPLLPLVALALVTFVVEAWAVWPRWTPWIAVPVTVFALVRQVDTLSRPPEAATRAWFARHAPVLAGAQSLRILSPLRQDEYAYLSWARRGVTLDPPGDAGVASEPASTHAPLALACASGGPQGGGAGTGADALDCVIARAR